MRAASTSLTLKSLSLAICLCAPLANATNITNIYRAALESDPQLRSAEATLNANLENVQLARTGLLPNISLAANTTWNQTPSLDYNNHGYTLSLSQPVFDASQWFTFKRGKLIGEQAEFGFEQAQQGLILRVVNAYLDVLRATNELTTTQAQERAIKRRLDQVNAQYEVGLIALTDVQEARATYDNARVARIEAEGAVDNGFEAIYRLTGQDIGDIDSLHEEYPTDVPTPTASKPWIYKAMKGNLAIQTATLETEIQRRSRQIARSGHLPTLSLAASHDYDNGSTSSATDGTTNSIGLSLSMPIYSGGSTSSQSRQALHQLTAAQENLDDTRREVSESIRNQLRDLRTSSLSIEALAQSLVSSKTALDATEEGYRVGTRNVVDVLSAEQQLYQTQRDYSNARLGYISTLFSLKQALGTLSPQDIYELNDWLVE